MPMTPWVRREVLATGYALLLVAVSGCAILDRFTSKRAEAPGGSDQELMSRAEAAMTRKKYDEGRKNLQRLINQFPESELVPAARLSVARSYFTERRYDEARAEYQRFIELFPQHERLDEAHYYMALSYFKQMDKPDRDQSFARKALAGFQTVAGEFKDSQYAPDARAKLTQCSRQLAEREIYVGKFYFHRGSYGAAIKRFEKILRDYPGSGYDDQALYYLGESLWELEQRTAAKAAFEKLVAQHPDSDVALLGAKRIGVTLVQDPAKRKPSPGFFSGAVSTVKDTFSELKDAFLDNDIWQALAP
ncbi:MAG: outer membrane protein assembly factor BamD [Candidatus Methylomirabilaceae bacterium]